MGHGTTGHGGSLMRHYRSGRLTCHVRGFPHTLACFQIVRVDQRLDTWRPRVHGTQLKALLNTRLPEHEEEFEAVEQAVSAVCYALRVRPSLAYNSGLGMVIIQSLQCAFSQAAALSSSSFWTSQYWQGGSCRQRHSFCFPTAGAREGGDGWWGQEVRGC
jgi:hypothetical protein